jgi:DNA polymerase III epsilon subunit family exonuclease
MIKVWKLTPCDIVLSVGKSYTDMRPVSGRPPNIISVYRELIKTPFGHTEIMLYYPFMIDANSIFIAFDTETTGLSAAQGNIVEIAALKFDLRGEVLDTFSKLVNPGTKIPALAMSIHHISDAMVADKPTIDAILPEFIDFINGDQNILIAQNALFDIGFVNHEAINTTIRLPRNIILDQIELTRRVFSDLPTYSLEATCQRFNLVDEQDHRAMSDAILVKKLFLYCLKQYASENERFAALNAMYHYSFGGPMVAKIAPETMTIINDALDVGATLEITYAGGSLKGKPRRIIPILLYNRDGIGYLTAKCMLSNANKQFRLDRIRECRPVK